jgi:hypothetical protein
MKRGTSTPDTNDLDVGEIGLDTSAGKMYFRADNNNIVDVTATGSGGGTDLADNESIKLGTGDDFELWYSGTAGYLQLNESNKDLYVKVNDGGVTRNAIQIDASESGKMLLSNGAYTQAGNFITQYGEVKGKFAVFEGGANQSQAYPLRVKQTVTSSGSVIAGFQGNSGSSQELRIRNYYNSFQLHHASSYSGIYFSSAGYIAPTANAMGYLGDGTVDLGANSYAFGDCHLQDNLYTQEEETGGFTSPKPAYSCRAWATIQTTGTTTLLKGKGISSISDIGVGKTQLNFTSTMPDTNYCVTANSHIADDDNNDTTSVSTRKDSYTTSSIQVQVECVDDGIKDVPKLHVVIHR